MTDSTDDDLRSFADAYERLLVLTDTSTVSPSLQPQFVARMLRARPADLVAMQELYDRIRAGDETPDLLVDVKASVAQLTSLLGTAETSAEPDRSWHLV